MVKFIGEYSGKVDDKGRVVFPAAFKSLMNTGEDSDMRFVIRKDIFADCLEMYPYAEWERLSEQIDGRLDIFNEEHAMFRRQFMRHRDIVSPDGKLGRILISRQLLESIGVTREVVFSGNDNKIELWAKEKYEAQELSQEQFVAIARQLSRQK